VGLFCCKAGAKASSCSAGWAAKPQLLVQLKRNPQVAGGGFSAKSPGQIGSSMAWADTIRFYSQGYGAGAIELCAWLPENLEQVHVRGFFRRSLRLQTVAGLGIALAMGLVPTMARAASASTDTVLQVSTHSLGGKTTAKAQITVAGTDGSLASGVVGIYDGSRLVASAALDSTGAATSEFTVAGGSHALRAVYVGDTSHTTSTSVTSQVTTQTTSSTPSFTLSLATTSLSLTAGQSGSSVITMLPANNSSLTAPMFITLSCSGLPDQSKCTFSPASVEITSTTATTACASSTSASTCPPTSTMTLTTQAAGTASNVEPGKTSTIAWALLIPGALGFGGLAFGARRKLWLSRMVLIALLAVVASLGLSGCNPQYYYYNHSPDTNPATPAGSYTVTLTGQSSDGITNTTASTTLALVVK